MNVRYQCLIMTGILFSFFTMLSGPSSSQPILTPEKPCNLPTAATKTSAPDEKKTKIQPKNPNKKSRKNKKKSVEKKEKRKTLRDMSYAELKVAKDKAILAHDQTAALRFFEKMVPTCNDLDELRTVMLEYADLLFDTGSLEKAGKMYREFSTLYPGSSKVEYASYKAILCSFYATLDAERDQTKTKDTIELAEAFLNRKEVYKIHVADVTTILADCRKKLFDNEKTIFSFYTHRGSYAAAQKRLEGMRKDFMACLPELEPQILALECELAEKQNMPEVLKKKQQELWEKFPAYSQQLAHAKAPKKFLGRF